MPTNMPSALNELCTLTPLEAALLWLTMPSTNTPDDEDNTRTVLVTTKDTELLLYYCLLYLHIAGVIDAVYGEEYPPGPIITEFRPTANFHTDSLDSSVRDFFFKYFSATKRGKEYRHYGYIHHPFNFYHFFDSALDEFGWTNRILEILLRIPRVSFRTKAMRVLRAPSKNLA